MIDVTNISPSPIHPEAKEKIQKKPAPVSKLQEENEFLAKIDPTYVWMDSNPQVREGAKTLYLALCAWLESKINREACANATWIEFALLSFDHALHRYENRHYRISLDSYSYMRIEKLYGATLQREMYHFLLTQEHALPQPDAASIERYAMLESGWIPVWWDRDGQLRAQEIVTWQEAMLLDMTPYRNSTLFKYPPTAKLIVKVYLTLIHALLDNEGVFPKRSAIRNRLEPLMNGEIHRQKRSYAFKNFLRQLLKVGENVVRRQLPPSAATKPLAEDKELEALKKRFLKKGIQIFEQTLAAQNELVDDKDIDELIVCLQADHAPSWPFVLEKVRRADPAGRVAWLERQKNEPDFERLLKEMLKQDVPLQLLALFLLIQRKSTPALQKQVKALLAPGRFADFARLLERPLSLSTYDALLALRQPLRKQIQLDPDQLARSKEDLEDTIRKIEAFLPEEPIEEKELALAPEKDDTPSWNEQNLVLLLLQGPLSMEALEDIARQQNTFPQALIDAVNEAYFSIVNDAILIEEDGELKIDPYYEDLVKEALPC